MPVSWCGYFEGKTISYYFACAVRIRICVSAHLPYNPFRTEPYGGFSVGFLFRHNGLDGGLGTVASVGAG